MNKRDTFVLLISSMMFLLAGLSVSAETVNLEVLDRDLEIPLQGVRITETNTGAEAVTNADGRAVLELEPVAGRAVLVAELIGYEPRRRLVKEFDEPVVLEMVIEGVLEGEELVVEEQAIGETDETVGVSTVIEREMIQSTARIGPIEDVMQSVKLLPGVTYGGPFGAFLSVRGGEPDGLTHVIDDFRVQFPYHWGGAFSIFNPNIVDSVKFSAGLFPVKYGQATSGLMEVNTVVPNDGLQWDYVQSTSTLEAFLELPLGADAPAGIFAGTRLTNYDLVLQVTGGVPDDLPVQISRVPYIYDFYLKSFYRPSERFEWFLNATSANDGTGAKLQPNGEGISNTFDFFWKNRYAFASTGASGLIGDRLLIDGLAGYEYWPTEADGSFAETGTGTYPESFKEAFEEDPLVSSSWADGNEFKVNFLSDFEQTSLVRASQGRVDAEYLLTDAYLFQTGLGAVYNRTSFNAEGRIWGIGSVEGEPYPVYQYQEVAAEGDDNRVLNSFTYLNLNAELLPDLLEGDLGLRLDHSYYRSGDLELIPAPTLGPRLSLRATPDWGRSIFRDHTFSGGVGILAKTPFGGNGFNPSLSFDRDDVPMTKTLLSILGWETRMDRGYRFRLETYYKYIYDRFYFNIAPETDEQGETENVFSPHQDGIGNATGFDVLLDRRTSRYFDGMLSYSFVYARYQDPQTDRIEDAGNQNPPRGRWYYPDFHRFHTLNLVTNVKPWPWLTISSVLTFASGAPQREFAEQPNDPIAVKVVKRTLGNDDSDPEEVAVDDPYYVPQYSRDTFYSDKRRGSFSLPLDIKASLHYYWPDRKVYTEAYVAVEDVLANLLAEIRPQSDAYNVDQWTGEITPAPQEGALSFVIPSLGFRLSY